MDPLKRRVTLVDPNIHKNQSRGSINYGKILSDGSTQGRKSLTPDQQNRWKATKHVKQGISAVKKFAKRTNDENQRKDSVRSDFSCSNESSSEDDEEDKVYVKLEDQLTNERLQALQKIFQSSNTNDDDGLDNDEFREAMRKTMGQHLTDLEIDTMFMKVDTNCDQTVDWDEYLSYMLLEYREKDKMKTMTQRKPLPENIKLVKNMTQYQRRHDTIVRLRHQPNIQKDINNLYCMSPEHGGKYISVSKNGIIIFWTMDLHHIRKHKLPPPESSGKDIRLWVMDLVCAPNLNMIAVATTAGTIVFYDLTAYSFQKVLTLADLEICVTCMDYWVDPTTPSRAKLIWGDTRGNIGALVFDDCASLCFLQPTINKNFKARVEFSELLKQTTCGVTAYNLPNVHHDLVIELRYFHCLHECVISCCRSNESSLHLGDLSRKKSSYFKVRKGVQTFDYSWTQDIIITGGKDSLIRVWNPYVPFKPVMVIQGTKSLITQVFVHEEGEYIFSISQDKEIHIFDLNTQACIQKIPRKNISLGPRPITAAIFNTAKHALILANNKLAILEKHDIDLHSQLLISHSTSVAHVLYNDLFHQVVSGGTDALVVVWDAETGERIIQFVSHKVPLIGAADVPVEITAMRFDPTQRRLITAARDGFIKIWNHNNGAMLRSIQVTDTNEIIGIVCPKQRILTAGWNRRITLYVDSYNDDAFQKWPVSHNEDITALALKPPNIIASAAYDGDILIWTIETGHVTLRFNPHISSKPIAKSNILKAVSVEEPESVNSDGSSSSDDEGSDKMNDEEEQMILRQFMSYNTHRASIAAPVPRPTGDNSNSDKSNVLKLRNRKQRLETIPSMMIDEDITSDKSSSNDNFLNMSSNNNYKENCFDSNLERLQYDQYLQKNESSVLKLLFLNHRISDKETATLVSASTGGWIRFWVVEHTGGLLGQFNAAHHPGESVQTICTNADNEYLITGDTEGYIKVWDIHDYCIGANQVSIRSERAKKDIYERFPLFHYKGKIMANLKSQSKHRPPPFSTDPKITWKAPELLNSFKGHIHGISGMAYIESSERIITSSSDCSIRIWTVYGQFIGIFGQDTPWQYLAFQHTSDTLEQKRHRRTLKQRRKNLQRQNDLKIVVKCKIPADVRSVASATTLRIFNGGIRRHWKLVRNVVLLCGYLMRLVRQNKVIRLRKPSTVAQDIQDLSFTRRMMQDTAKLDLINIKREIEKINTTGLTSSILGKSYRAPMKHKPLPILPKLRVFHTQCDAYASLPYYELAHVSNELQPPPTIIDIQESQPNILNLHNRFNRSIRKAKHIIHMSRNDKDAHMQKRRMSRSNRYSGTSVQSSGLIGTSKNSEGSKKSSVTHQSQNTLAMKEQLLPPLECDESLCF